MKAQHRTQPISTWKKAAFAIGALVVMAGPASAVGFLPVLDGLPDRDIRVTTAEGQVFAGEVRGTASNSRGLTRITLVEPSGAKHRLKIAELKQVVVPTPVFAHPAMVAAATTTLEKAVKTDWERLSEVRELVFDSVPWPGGGKRVLLMRVNPGFDRRVQVYGLPNAKEGTTRINEKAFFGDEPKAFLVVKDGGEPSRIGKGNYRESFETLFADCPALLERVPRDERKFKHFADHLYEYETACP